MSLLSLLWVFPVHADIFVLKFEGQEIQIPFNRVEGLLLNDFCERDTNRCQALKASRGVMKSKVQDFHLSSVAQNYCQQIDGTPLTLLTLDGRGVSFCSFDDNTIISSWDLYNRVTSNGKSK